MIPFFARQWIEVLRERIPKPVAPRGGVYDVTPDKWRGLRTRPPGVVERIVVHQTAVEFGVTRRQIAAAGGDRDRAHRLRFQATPYHYVITLRGELLRVHPIHRWTYHAGPANRRSIGVAFEGLFPRFERTRSKKHTLPSGVIRALWRRHFAEVVNDHPDLVIVTHAQVTARRSADPGEWIMRQIVQGIGTVDHAWGRPTPGEWRT